MTTLVTDDDRELLAQVLAPIAGDNPSGVDLRHDEQPRSIYSRLRDARADARAEERASDNDVASDGRWPAGWTAVEAMCIEALTERSKDLELACWLAESLTRRRGLAGLALSASIMSGLVERYWDDGLYPPFDPEDPDARTFAVGGLSGADRDGSLMQPLRKLVLFELSDGRSVTFWQYERARSVAILNEAARRLQYEKAGVFPLDILDTSARGSGRAMLVSIGHAAREARNAWVSLDAAIEAKGAATGAGASTARVRALLDEIGVIVERHVPDAFVLPTTSDDAVSAGEVAADGAGEGRPERSARPDREVLLDDLLRIAALFRDSEPNSPLSYTLEEAVRRARLPLPDLLRELIPELSPRSNVLTLLGLRPPSE